MKDFLLSFFLLKEETEIMYGKTLAYFDRDLCGDGGSLYFYIDEKEYPLKAGEFLIINSNEVHSIQAPVRNETIVLQIPLKQFSDYFTAQRFIRFRSRNEESEETDRRMVFLIREMYRVYVSGETGYEFRIRAVFYEVLYLMVSAYRETEVEENALKISRRLDALSKITTYMREHYKEDLRLSGLAAMFGYSDAYLSRMFRKYARSILRHIYRISAWHTPIRSF